MKKQQERLEKFLTSRTEPKGLFSSPPVPIENWGQECQKWSGGEELEKGANFQASIKSSTPGRLERLCMHDIGSGERGRKVSEAEMTGRQVRPTEKVPTSLRLRRISAVGRKVEDSPSYAFSATSLCFHL